MEINFIVDDNTSIKEFIIKKISRNFYGYLKEHNVKYFVNEKIKKSYELIYIGEKLQILYDEVNEQEGYYSSLPLDIIYEDDNYVVINKEAHLQTIPSRNNPYDSVYNRLLYHFKNTNFTINIVNRLDKETSGLILVCKNNYSRAILKDFNKVYYATTNVELPLKKGRLDFKIKKETVGIKRCVASDGVSAITNYELFEVKNGFYTYKINLETGRTHQIRVHFAHISSPLINDTLYGGYETETKKLGLVCKEISFTKLNTNEVLKFTI